MPQRESPDESVAADCARAVTGLPFEFTDLGGDVDYTSRQPPALLEVTRYNDPLLRADMRAAEAAEHVYPLGTSYSWDVTFDGYPRYDELPARLYHPLRTLGEFGLHDWREDTMAWWQVDVPLLKDTITSLRKEKVLWARARSAGADGSLLHVSSSGGWSYGGPDAALAMVEARVAVDRTHIGKLTTTKYPERHLWVWTDQATPKGIRRGLQDSRLPSRAPTLPAAVTQLWIVDDAYLEGIRWDGSTWQKVILPGGPATDVW